MKERLLTILFYLFFFGVPLALAISLGGFSAETIFSYIALMGLLIF